MSHLRCFEVISSQVERTVDTTVMLNAISGVIHIKIRILYIILT